MDVEKLASSIKNVTREEGLFELQHRIINTLQSLISYIGIMYADRDHIAIQKIDKLVRFIRSLAILYSVSTPGKKDSEQIRLDEVIQAIVQLYANKRLIEVSGLVPVHGTFKNAATLCLIMNELLDNALQFGNGAISVKLENTDGGGALLHMINSVPEDGATIVQAGTGLRLVELVSKAEFNSAPVICLDAKQFEVSVRLPVCEL